MEKVCLVIIFNHRFIENITVLEKIYAPRFSNIFYLIPFHTGEIEGMDNSRIIPVYETSYCLQGYMAQAYDKIKRPEFSHYVFLGDDQILNPELNEKNLLNELQLDSKDSFIKNITPYAHSVGDQSNKLFHILSAFRINVGVSYEKELPSCREAAAKCKKLGYPVVEKLPLAFFLHKGYLHPKHFALTIVTLAINKGRTLPYPLFKSYADMIIIDRFSMDEFCRLSGIFAAMNLFVETAIPLAMILACTNIKTEGSINGYYGVEKWREEIPEFERKYNHDLDVLFDQFEEKVLYYHPIKLSKWRYRT